MYRNSLRSRRSLGIGPDPKQKNSRTLFLNNYQQLDPAGVGVVWMALVRVLVDEANGEEEQGLSEGEARLLLTGQENLRVHRQSQRWNRTHMAVSVKRRIRAGLWILRLQETKLKYEHRDLANTHPLNANL